MMQPTSQKIGILIYSAMKTSRLAIFIYFILKIYMFKYIFIPLSLSVYVVCEESNDTECVARQLATL